MKLTGYYNEYGYQVESDNPCDCILYRVGNHALDSQQDGTDTEHQLPLTTIKEYCEQTTKEMVDEKQAEFCGVEYLHPEDI
jgi:hypothetical protein